MRSKKTLVLFVTAFTVVLGLLTIAAPIFAARRERVKALHSFQPNGTDGFNPEGSLIFDAAGNLYGTTAGGGAYGEGTVFQLTPGAGGTWTETLLYSFNDNGIDGTNPFSSLIFDKTGNLYGTTEKGGVHGGGTVFQLTPGAGGTWTETVLHSFNPFNGKDGYLPYASVVLDGAGNLYGTTTQGGDSSGGTVFQLKPGTNGKWTEKVLHSFHGEDGYSPWAGLLLDAGGNLYGTTYTGGEHTKACGLYGCGTVFQLTPGASGKWREKVLHSFNEDGKDGFFPLAGLICDASGNLYGTTYQGGAFFGGTVFELEHKTRGKWTEKRLHRFGLYNDGVFPLASLSFDASGNLWGTTNEGGAYGFGIVFQLTGRGWVEEVRSFNPNGKVGIYPNASLVLDTDGNLYSTNTVGGAYGYGTVFEITP